MRTRSLSLALAVSSLLGLSSVGLAADVCFNSGSLVFVAKRFSVPRHGTCRTIQGQQVATGTVMHGVACTRENGTTLRVQTTTTQLNPANIEWDHYDLALPSLTGSVRVMTQNFSTGASSQTTFIASAGPCSPSTIDIQ